ncbi:MAG: tetratricopeptide repeat protein [Candidatus Omnitrophica bacterium]|nr:tetratricopeptide repeat protein [Candidatus Omnitrophota bacterium]
MIIITVFIFLNGAVALLWTAERQLDKAKKLESNYRFKKAKEKYQSTLRLNPFNAQYFAQSAEFSLRASRQHKEKEIWLKEAEELFQRACKLNPEHAEYRYMLGEVCLELGKREEALDDFKLALEKDPYNFRNNYLIAYNLLKVWRSLSEAEKSFAKDRLGFILSSGENYKNNIYPTIIYFAKDFKLAQQVTPRSLKAHEQLYSLIEENNLWQYRRAQQNMVDFYREKEDFKAFSQHRKEERELLQWLRFKKSLGDELDWVGTSRNGNVYEDGEMYWSGTMHKVLDIPAHRSIIIIRAKGESAADIWPYMVVELDGEEIGETFVDKPEWREYHFKINSSGGLKVLSVTFANDGGDSNQDTDRNLYIGEAKATPYGIWWND